MKRVQFWNRMYLRPKSIGAIRVGITKSNVAHS